MNARSRLVFPVVLGAVLIAGGTALVAQWRETGELRVALERAKADATDLARLREENVRLRVQAVSPAELERLRVDHAALSRLRAELEALQRPRNAGQ